MARASIITRGIRPIIVKTKREVTRTRTRNSAWPRPSAATILFAGVTLVCAGFAVQQLQASARFADLLHLSEVIKPTDRNAAVLVSDYAGKAEEIVERRSCRSDIVNAGLGFVLADLDLQNSVTDFDAWTSSLERADRYIQHALSCSPGDGNLWVRLALVRRAGGENPQELAALLAQSALLFPAEIDALSARFVLWRSVSQETLDLAATTADTDLRTVLLYLRPTTVRSMLENSSPQLKARVSAMLPIVPPERLEFFKKYKLDLAALSS